MVLLWKLSKNNNINIDETKNPMKKPKREVYTFTIFDSIYYHPESITESTVVRKNRTIHKAVLHLPTIEYNDYSHMKENLNIPDEYTLLKDGRPNSKSTSGYYKPHIVGRKASEEGFIKSLKRTINYYENNNVKKVFV